MNDMKGITGTVIFESSALNRDQSVGNITTLKKLSVGTDSFVFLSRPWVTNKLFSTLAEIYPDSWKPGELTSSKGVIQHRLLDTQDRELKIFQDIVRNAELDAFGYMSTAAKTKKRGKDTQKEEEGPQEEDKSSSTTLSRKAAVSLTKAIALYPWRGDMSFYANHAFVSRMNASTDRTAGKLETPNPYSREEDYNLFKFSFTIDLTRFGKDLWVFDEATMKKLSGNLKEFEEEIEKASGKALCDTNAGSISFELSREKKIERVIQILDVIKNGLLAQCAGENYGILPSFMIVAGLKAPVPLFHPDIYFDKRSGELSFSSLSRTIAQNDYIIRKNGTTLVHASGKEKMTGWKAEGSIEDWKEFKDKLKECM